MQTDFIQNQTMKLEYLNDISDGGKYKDVVSENLIRLYDFDQNETLQLAELFYKQLAIVGQSLELTSVAFIQSINCKLTLELSSKDEGVLRTEKVDEFICKLTKSTLTEAIENMKAVSDGYNWLCDTSKDDIDFLYSSGGTW
jgi:hypothetical protein